MPSRFALPPAQYAELKKKVYQRDGWVCRSCRSRTNLTAHHIVFRSEGGGDFSGNLVTLCGSSPGHIGCHDCVHGKVGTKFIQILNPTSDDIPPDADYSLKFRKYNTVRRRKTWRIPQ